MTCACGTEIAPSLLACPACRRLVHAEGLKRLAAAAGDAVRRGEPLEEVACWRRALELLPPGSQQAEQVAARIAALDARAAADTAPPPGAGVPGQADGAAKSGKTWGLRSGLAAGMAFLLTKAKLLLLGLTKAGTLFTMLLSVGVYWSVFGWRFAVLLVLSIYVHEMGHVAALRRLGLPASAPMFIPGLGALIRLRQRPANPRDDARIGLAGPIWGLGAALVAWLGFRLGWGPLWGAVARFGAWINLFNLLPFWQLDGGRAFHALSRRQRLLAAAALAALWAWSREGLLVLLLIGAGAQAFRRDAPAEDDWPILAQFVGLAAILTLITQVPLPELAGR
jgi:Zn-dependent protease